MVDGNMKIVAILKCFVYWRTYFLDILFKEGLLLAVLENACGDVYSYKITGVDVQYLGPGDLHEPKYDSLEETADFKSFAGLAEKDKTYEGQ
jgi:hypothetical protein